jgi:hypothetical protein
VALHKALRKTKTRGVRKHPLVVVDPQSLPAWFATRAATTARATARPAAATTATGASTAAATTESSTATAAETAVGLGTGFVHVQCTSVQCVPIESGNGLIRLAFILHFNECETAGTAGFTIRHDSSAVYLAIAFEEAADTLFGSIEIQVAYEYILHSSLLSI